MLGDRPCVRQSTLYRQHCGGNEMKSLLGQDQLKWDTKQVQGCYAGRQAYEFNGSLQDGPHPPPSQDLSKAENRVPPSMVNSEPYGPSGGIPEEMAVDGRERENANRVISSKPSNPVYTNCRVVGGAGKHRFYGGDEVQGQSTSFANTPVMRDTYPVQVHEEVGYSSKAIPMMAQTTPQRNIHLEETTPISGSRKLRPGAGYANKQSYNIFTGE